MRLIEIATERRVTVIMFTVAVFLFGTVSLDRLKLNLLPDISYPTLTVRTELTGAAPAEIENLLSKPIEESVGVIKNVRRVRSVSRSGQSDVTLEFIWGTNMDVATVDVREKLDILTLPLDAKRPVLLRFDPSNEPIIRMALRDSRVTDLTEDELKVMRRFAEERLKTDFESVEGTAAVKIAGGLEDEIEVRVDQEKLAQLGLSIQEISTRLGAENVNLSGGSLEQGAQRYLVRTVNEFASVPEMADSIIASRDGRPVYLNDVAQVTQGYKEREAVTRVDGNEAVELAVFKEGDANTVQVAEAVRARLQRVGNSLPDGYELELIYDQSSFIDNAIDEVYNAAIIGGLLAVIVLFLFLGDARPTFIIALTIPVSVIGTFMLMHLGEITLNIMSLGGIALAIGLLVDNSIVVLENIARKREQGVALLPAAREGASEVGTAVIASTLTTVAVFFPMVFVSGIAGQLFKDQALTVTFALLFSLLVALTLIPMLAAWGGSERFKEDSDLGRSGIAGKIFSWILTLPIYTVWGLLRLIGYPLNFLGRYVRRFFDALSDGYPKLLSWALERRALVVIVAAAVFAGTVAMIPRLGSELIPELSQGEFKVDVRLQPGAPLVETDRAIQSLQSAASDIETIEMTYSVAGTGNRLDASPTDAGEHTGTLNVVMRDGVDESAEERAISQLREALESIPGVEFEFSRPELFSFSTPLELEISGYDLTQLRSATADIVSRMNDHGGFADINSSVEDGNPEVQIVFDHERAARLGLAVRDIADTVVAKVRGELATRYTLRDRKIDVVVRSVNTRDASVAEIGRLIVNPASDRPVTLNAVADITIAEGPAEIRRVDQERVAVISASFNQGDLATGAAELREILRDAPLPPDILAQVTGQSEEMEASFSSMRFALIMAVFLVYLVMASQFESLLHPFVILFTIPLALVGAVAALFLTGTTINVVVFIGVIMLAGIVVNNAIVLIDLINQLRQQGRPKREAIMEAGRARLRPIMMTTLTTVLGLLPMAIGVGEGAEVRAPMAITVIGGLIVSTLLTLVLIPVVYSLLDRKRMDDETGFGGVL